MDLTIVVPAFDEQERIGSTLETMVSFLDTEALTYEILVVDDGSSDDTAQRVRDVGVSRTQVKLLQNPGNRGKGYSVRHGVGQAQGEVVGFVDADDKTEIQALPIFLRELQAGYDCVLGDRTMPESQIALDRRSYRKLGSNLFKYLVRYAVGLADFPDTQCGFKFFRAEIARDLFARQRIDGYMFDVEILILAKRSGFRMKRQPVIWRDDPDSRFKPLSGTLRNLGELIRIILTHR
jgi:dolichyl-phosphate beta-glucosyltransferase